MSRFAPLLSLVTLIWCGAVGAEETPWRAGFGKVDITPKEPVRLSGYGSRDHVNEGVDMPLFVRSVAIESDESPQVPLVLVSVDTIGLPGSLTRALAATLKERHGLSRSQVVFCSTHTHCAPTLDANLSNIFSTPLSEAESAAAVRYRDQVRAAVLESVETALKELAPAVLSFDVGKAAVAANRRLLVDGRWSGFGVQKDGPVDHSVPVLRIAAPDGELRGLIFNYACHCTSLGGDHYRVNGDWAGYATAELETAHPDAVALCTIGCGADANPVTRGNLEDAVLHGKTLAREVARVIESTMRPIESPAESNFDYAALSFELPTQEELRERLQDKRPQTRRHAQEMLDIYEAKHRLPATYPVPIQSWRFGDQLTMVFLGGEVVVDYALRLKKSFDDPNLWVTAYANDVMGYVVSERMRQEGGYEYDYSGVYYGLPGPWASGTEDKLISAIERLVRERVEKSPLDADQSLNRLQISEGYQVELVAAEPLITDPINFAFAADGRLWVVEMGDYPEGDQGGRIKTLTDFNRDGRFDQAVTFLDGLSFPTGVQPWRDGVLISAAPDVLFARDTDGDGVADDVQTLYTGFRLANPQHRVSGFTYGLDDSFHLASGDNLGEIKSVVTGDVVDASGHDVKIWPGSGRIEVTSGRTQYLRSRDDWGHWFGSDNSRPGFFFPIEDRYLTRNIAVRSRTNSQSLFDPAVAPPVYPITRSTQRFNDLYAANRFTSACSSLVARSPQFRVGGRESLFVCEPVHNLVHRSVIIPDGSTYRAERLESEQRSEFLASSDPWFRPVCAKVGLDGALWVADMYREVIEHPEWIPEAWQQQVDLRGGENHGRIYRISRIDSDSDEASPLEGLSTAALSNELRSPIGPRRDVVQRSLMDRSRDDLIPVLKDLALSDESPETRVHALSMLAVIGDLKPEPLLSALQSDDPGLVCGALRLSEPFLDTNAKLRDRVCECANHQDLSVVLQTALSLGECRSPEAGAALARIAVRPENDVWIARALASSASEHAEIIAASVIESLANAPTDSSEEAMELFSNLLATVHARGGNLDSLVTKAIEDPRLGMDAKLTIASSLSAKQLAAMKVVIQPLLRKATRLVEDDDRPLPIRMTALRLIALQGDSDEAQRSLLFSLLVPSTPPALQAEAVACLSSEADETIADALLERWPTMSLSLRQQCVNEMLSRRVLHEKLLEAIEIGRVRLNDLTPAAKQQLLQSGSRSMKVRAARLVNVSTSPDKQRLIRRYLDELADLYAADDLADDLANDLAGETLFKKHCGACHLPNASGSAVGASLDNLTDRSTSALVTSVLDPNRSVDPKYQSYAIQTRDGRVLVGVIESEVGISLTLAHADGKRTTLRRDEIEAMKNSGTSLMPEGFESTLTPKQLHAIVRYLQRR